METLFALSLNKKKRFQLQITLRLESYIASHDDYHETSVDGDFIWELADSIRWLARVGKERFKLERFLYDELCPVYESRAPLLMRNLLEELGFSLKKKDTTENEQNALASSRLGVLNPAHSFDTFSANIDMVSEAIRNILEKSSKPSTSGKKKKRKSKK